MGEKTPEELDDSEIFYDLDRYPKIGMGKDRSTRGPSNGYLTMVNVRHPFSRLLSAYRDKFRKGHPWMKIVEPKFGFVLKKFEKKNMEVEVKLSLPFFLNLILRCLNIHSLLFWNWQQHQSMTSSVINTGEP